MELCFPALAQDVDWSRKIEFLEQELKRISRRSATGDRYVDKLARLWLRNGIEQRVLLHLELQAQQRVAYEEHVFEYNVLARLFYKLPVVSVVILADSNAQWRPTTYKTALWGCEHTFQFPIVKLLDIAQAKVFIMMRQFSLDLLDSRVPGNHHYQLITLLLGLFQEILVARVQYVKGSED